MLSAAWRFSKIATTTVSEADPSVGWPEPWAGSGAASPPFGVLGGAIWARVSSRSVGSTLDTPIEARRGPVPHHPIGRMRPGTGGPRLRTGRRRGPFLIAPDPMTEE